MKRLIRLTAAAAIAALAASPAARAEILYSESTSYFELGENLRTKNDIWKAIKRNGPLVGGKHAIGSASGGIGYHFKMRQSGGRCTITEVQFKLDVKIRLPEWQYEYQAPQDAKDFFACVLQTVTIHEKKHADIWYQTVNQMEDAFLSELQGVPCDGIKAQAQSIYNRIYDVSRQRQADFDKADQQRGRYDRCARGEDNWESVRAIPEVSGRSAWSDVTREAPQWTRASRAERPRNEESEAAANTRTAQATPQETSSAQQSQGGESLQVEFDGLALLPFVAGLFAVFAAGGLFFAFSANSSKSSRFDIDEMEERSPDDWTKRAIRKVSDRTDA